MDNLGYLNSDGDDQKLGTKGDHGDEGKTAGVVEFKSSKFPQILAALAALLGAFSFGNVLCYSAVAMPSLREDKTFPPTTQTEISWITSIATLGALATCLPIGFAIDWLGRRKTMLLLSCPFITGWLLIYFAQNVNFLMAGRFITGFSGGAFSFAAPIFIAETSESSIRGMLISGYDLMACVGIVFILTIGTFVEWRAQALICAFVPLLFTLILCLVPESPRHLISKGLQDEAFKSLCWLRGASGTHTRHIMPEFQSLRKSLEEDQADSSTGWRVKWEELKTRPVLKALLLSAALFFFQVFCGINAVDFYCVDIFKSAGSSLDAYTCSISISAVGAVASVCSASIVDRCGRRILMISSELLMALSMAGLGAFFYVKGQDAKFALQYLSWLPLASLMLFIVGYAIGVGPIPFSVMPELLPQRLRGLVSSLLLSWKWSLTFLVGRFFVDMMKEVGEAAGYWIFSAICLIGGFFVLLFLPETKGKSLEQIQWEMKGRPKEDKPASALQSLQP